MGKWKWIAIGIAAAILMGVGFWWLSQPSKAMPPIADPITRAETLEGPVVGFVDATGSHAWQGIRFARPPVGELRWRAPLPPEPRAEPLLVTAPGSACTQLKNPLADFDDPDGDGVIGSEDCLYLNVYAPAERSPGALPVMFWIHGGGNSIGHAGPYHGGVLAQRHGVVVVAANYRLGPFGWFSHPALRDADPESASGNYGTLDIIRGLEWVRDNIAGFGGDPGNVTVFGESAGGFNALSLMISPRAGGLFHAAIVQSGGLNLVSRAEAENFASDAVPGHAHSSREVFASLLRRRGMAEDEDQARSAVRQMPDAQARALLYQTPAAEIMSLYDAGGSLGMIYAPTLFADGQVVPTTPPLELFASGDYNAVPIILGTNRDEVKLFMALNEQWVERWLGFLPRIKDVEAYQRAAHYGSARWRYQGVDNLARSLAAVQDRVFAYRFDWDEETSILGYDLAVAMGAAHGLEIAFVFGRFSGTSTALGDIYDEAREPQRDALSASMMSYWTEFAHRGDPGRGRGGNLVTWLPWNLQRGKHKTIIFDTPEDGGIRMAGDELTLDGLKSSLRADQSLPDQHQRCRAYASLFLNTEGWDDAEYQALGDGGCGDYPADQFGLF